MACLRDDRRGNPSLDLYYLAVAEGDLWPSRVSPRGRHCEPESFPGGLAQAREGYPLRHSLLSCLPLFGSRYVAIQTGLAAVLTNPFDCFFNDGCRTSF